MYVVSECLVWWKNVDDLSSACTRMLLNRDRITKLILTCMSWPKELCEIVLIIPIDLVMFIDPLPISDVFSDSYTRISLKRDDPETQKRLWLHYNNRTPDQSLATWSSANSFESSALEQFHLNET